MRESPAPLIRANTITKYPDSLFPSTSKYRSDIDGLRGISIIAVVLFHARVPGFDGGYVGVDVFFVISGYLITSILLQRTGPGLGLIAFYERRIRRLFPALFCVLISCAVISAFLLLPDELDRFGGSLVATTLFGANIFFWRHSDYFSPLSENAPLLHMWSLGVEEQFYLFYPVTLLLISRFAGKKIVMIIAAMAVSSFLLSVWAIDNQPSAGFYLAPTRAWELLMGALISMRALPQLRDGIWRESCAIFGLALIGWSVVNFSEDTAFPGYIAFLPCAGTALIIYTGATTGTAVARALSARPVVFLGLISYSLYLWHWPMLAFSRRYAIRDLDRVETTIVIFVAVLISVLSWKFIEMPFRKREGVWGRTKLFKAASYAAVSTVALGAIFATFDGFPELVSPTVQQYAQGASDGNPDRDKCHRITPQQIRAGQLCRLGERTAQEPTFIVWGDSHADAMMPVLKTLAEAFGTYGLYASHSNCPPLVDTKLEGRGATNGCEEFNEEMLAVIDRYESAAVVLIAYWDIYLDSEFLANDHTDSMSGSDSPFAVGLDRTLQSIATADRKVWLVQQVPIVNFDPPGSLAMAERRGIEKDFLRPSVEFHEANTSEANEIFALAQKRYSLSLINPRDVLCDQVRCDIEYDGKSLYRDYHHLSTFGAQYLQPGLEKIFVDILAQQ